MSYEMIGELSVSTEDKVLLPDGNLIALADSGVYPTWNLHGDLHFCNHNIFRLDKNGNVVWQVQRDDKGAINWERIMAEVAKGDKGDPETIRHARKPFTTLYLLDSEGNDLTKTGKWVNGLTLYGLSVNYGGRYQIDIDTGIATNITESPTRDW